MSKPQSIAFTNRAGTEAFEHGHKFTLAKKTPVRVTVTCDATLGKTAVRVYGFFKRDGIPFQGVVFEKLDFPTGVTPRHLDFELLPVRGLRQHLKVVAWNVTTVDVNRARLHEKFRIRVTGSRPLKK